MSVAVTETLVCYLSASFLGVQECRQQKTVVKEITGTLMSRAESTFNAKSGQVNLVVLLSLLEEKKYSG